MKSDVIELVHAAFARRGHEGYGEGVSQLDHALQCGAFARWCFCKVMLLQGGCSATQSDNTITHDPPKSGPRMFTNLSELNKAFLYFAIVFALCFGATQLTPMLGVHALKVAMLTPLVAVLLMLLATPIYHHSVF